MITVGEILKNKRIEKKITLVEVEKATHIRLRFLEALEKGRYDLMPAGAFTRGFVRNYASFLGLNVEDVLAFYRRETLAPVQKIPQRDAPKIRRFVFTPKVFAVIGTILSLLVFFGYLAFQYFSYSGKPFLEITAPSDYLVVKEDTVKLVGRTDSGATLRVNEKIVSSDEAGNFSIAVPLSAGLNVLTVVAENKFKKQTEVVRHVRLESP